MHFPTGRELMQSPSPCLLLLFLSICPFVQTFECRGGRRKKHRRNTLTPEIHSACGLCPLGSLFHFATTSLDQVPVGRGRLVAWIESSVSIVDTLICQESVSLRGALSVSTCQGVSRVEYSYSPVERRRSAAASASLSGWTVVREVWKCGPVPSGKYNPIFTIQ